MNIIWIILLTLGFAESGFSQRVTVINSLGAAVYEQPTFESPRRAKYPLGETFRVERVIETKDRYIVGEGFSFEGKWLKPVGVNGYVFSSDVTENLVRVSQTEYGKVELHLLGELLYEKEDVKMIKTENGEFPESTNRQLFENGSVKETYWDGCVSSVIEYEGLTVSEAYHHMANDLLSVIDGVVHIPMFSNKSLSTLMFDLEYGLTEDVKMFVSVDGKVVVTYITCY